MIVHGQWPNLERALIAWLRPALTAFEDLVVVSDMREGWKPPLVSIEQIPGDGGVDLDVTSTIDITVYALDRPTVWDITRAIHPRMVALPGRGPVMVDTVEGGGFGIISYSDRAITRALGTYRLVTRPQ